MNPLRETPHPLLLEIPARPWLRALSDDAARPLALADVPDGALDEIVGRGFHGVWLMGVWETGAAGRELALSIEGLRAEYDRILPGWRQDDVDGSPYCVADYTVARVLGGDEALATLRERLRARGLGLVLDFVPNHFASDHRWLDDHPELLVRGSADDLAHAPDNWFAHAGASGEQTVFAHGRDPYFPGWTDTVQLDYRRSETRSAMTEKLRGVAARCDGLRCDMAMLVLPDVFRSTWGDAGDGACFWSEAIPALRREQPDAVLIAEVYWGLEERLHHLGFDYTYDKELYDRLVGADVNGVHDSVHRPEESHRHRVRFLENHDEPRAMETFGDARFRAAAAVTYSLPGLRFFQEGQAEGRRVRTPVQLGRAPREEAVPGTLEFHDRLFTLLARDTLHRGTWSPLELREAHGTLAGNRWTSPAETVVVVGNLGETEARARIPFDLPGADDDAVRVEDSVTGEHFERSRREMREAGIEWTVPGGHARLLRAPAA